MCFRRAATVRWIVALLAVTTVSACGDSPTSPDPLTLPRFALVAPPSSFTVWTFSGDVTGCDQECGALLGTSVRGWIGFDPNQLDLALAEEYAPDEWYPFMENQSYFTGPGLMYEINLGGTILSGSGRTTASNYHQYIRIADQSTGDAFRFHLSTGGYFNLRLGDDTGAMFAGDALPATPPALAPLSEKSILFTGVDDVPRGLGIALTSLTEGWEDITEPVALTSKAECMNGGWETFGFRNQGQCIRFVQTGRDSR